MKYLLLLIMGLLSFYIQAHDFNMSVFSISKVKDEVKLNIRLDKEDLIEKALKSNEIDPFAKEKIIQYLENNISTQLNSKDIKWKYEKVIFEENIIIIEASVKEVSEEIKSLNLTNTTLIGHIPDHKSIIHFNLFDKRRSFKMDENRTVINISY